MKSSIKNLSPDGGSFHEQPSPPADDPQTVKVRPREILESLARLRLAQDRIQTVGDGLSQGRSGGKADVEAAILIPRVLTDTLNNENIEYIAVKKLRLDEDSGDDRALASFAHEIKLLSEISHLNIVKVVGFVENVKDGIAWMIFPWERNGNLREYVRSAEWELPERLSLIYDVIEGLEYLHTRNPPICHGDLKSLNILVNNDNRAVITDFGSARAIILSHETEEKPLTATKNPNPTEVSKVESLAAEVSAEGGSITLTGPAWTIRWAAPELLNGSETSLTSDVWAFGWVCWEAITGNFPFDDETDMAVIPRIIFGDIPNISADVQLQQMKALCGLMMDCWKIDATKRPTASQCRQQIYWMETVVPSPRSEDETSLPRSGALLWAIGAMKLQNASRAEAEMYFKQALSVATSVGDEGGRASALLGIGEVYRADFRFKEADECFDQAAPLFLKAGDELGLADVFQRKGMIYQFRHEYSKAEQSCIEARNILSKFKNNARYALVVHDLGSLFFRQGKDAEAEEAFMEAQTIFSATGHLFGVALSTDALGLLYHSRGQLLEAKKACSEAREIYTRIGNPSGIATSACRLGDIFHAEGELAKAEELYKESRDINAGIGNRLGQASAIRNLGKVHSERGELQAATAAFTEARDAFSQIGFQFGYAESTQMLARIHYTKDEIVKAEELFVEVEKIYTEIVHPPGLAYTQLYIAAIRYGQLRYEEARDYATAALGPFKELGLEKEVTRCNRLIAGANRAMRRATTGTSQCIIS